MASKLDQIEADIAETKVDIAETKVDIAETKALIVTENAKVVRDRDMILVLHQSLTSQQNTLTSQQNTLTSQLNLLLESTAAVTAPPQVTFEQVQDIVTKAVAPMTQLVPIVCNLMIEANNLWTKTQMADTMTDRSEAFKSDLITHLGYVIGKKKRKRVQLKFKCMVSGLESLGKDVEAAHIVPARSNVKSLAHIGMTAKDVNDVRNGLLLATEIHQAFDKLQLSFVKTNPLSQQLYLKIWDTSCSSTEVYPGAGQTIGDYDGYVLNLGNHEPFKRALSYQAYTAYLRFGFLLPSNIKPTEYGTENNSKHFSYRRLMKDAVIQDMKIELDDGEDDRSNSLFMS